MNSSQKPNFTQTEEFFLERRNRADREAFRRILNRRGGEAPGPEEEWSDASGQLPGTDRS